MKINENIRCFNLEKKKENNLGVIECFTLYSKVNGVGTL